MNSPGVALSRSRLWNRLLETSIRVPGKESRCVGGNKKSISRISGSVSRIRENGRETRSTEFRSVQGNRARVINPAAGATSIAEIPAKSAMNMFSFF